MSAMGDYLEDKLLDHVFGNASYTAPANLYLALFTADNGIESGDLSGEVSAGGYTRVQMSASDFLDASGGATNNVNDIVFPTASADWGTITHAAIMDASANGNVLFHGAFSVQKTVWSGDVFKVRSGDLTVSFD